MVGSRDGFSIGIWPSMLTWENALKAAPLIAIFAVAVSILYGFGYFGFPGRDWLTILTLQDLFALAWKSLPALAIGLAISPLMAQRRDLLSGLHLADFKELYVGASSARRAFLFAYEVVVLLIPFAAITFLNTLPVWADPAEVTRYIYIVLVIAFLGSVRAAHFVSDNGLLNRPRQIGLVLGFGIFVYGSAIADGALHEASYLGQITLKGMPAACVATLFAGERGVIYRQVNGATTFVRWDTVATLGKLDAPCWPPTQHLRTTPPRRA